MRMIGYCREVGHVICKKLSPSAIAALRIIRVACRLVCDGRIACYIYSRSVKLFYCKSSEYRSASDYRYVDGLVGVYFLVTAWNYVTYVDIKNVCPHFMRTIIALERFKASSARKNGYALDWCLTGG